MTEPARVDMPDWIRTLAASHPFGAGDRRGRERGEPQPPGADL